MDVFSNASVLMLGQFIAKILTFSLNQFLLAYVTPSSLGLAHLLEFVISYILFLSRESLRLSISKLPPTSNKVQYIINYSYLSLILFAIVSIPIKYFEFYNNPDIEKISSNQLLLYLINFSIIIELLSEPFFCINQFSDLNFTKRTKIEGLASFIKCVVQFLTIVHLSKNFSDKDSNYVFSYILAQLAYAITLLICYVSSSKISFPFPKKINGSFLDPVTFSYFKSIFFQQIFKNFLTEGDKLVISSLLDLDKQGYYSIITNYGSIFARLLFLPIEESTRIYITSIFKSKITEKEKLQKLNWSLARIFNMYIYLLTLLVIFAPINTKFLVNLLFKNFANTEELVFTFKIYWFYIPFLSVNGILEALFTSVFSNGKELNKYSFFMLINSMVYFCNLGVFIKFFRWDLKGLVIANMINMGLRIIFSLVSLSTFINWNRLELHRYKGFLSLSVFIWILQLVLFDCETKSVREFGISLSCGCLLVFAILYIERNTILKRANMKIETKSKTQ